MRLSLVPIVAAFAAAPVAANFAMLSQMLTPPKILADGTIIDEASAQAFNADAAAGAANGGLHKRSNVVAATFDQLIDHDRPELGTFKQRYWVNDEFYAGAGSPVILTTPGESAADLYTGYTTNRTITGEFGQQVGGAVVLIEHRYWGGSAPYDTMTTTNLQQHTLKNAIMDLVYFAKNVRFHFDKNGTSTPDKAPWALSGCSYPGALTAWVNKISPGTFWAYHASSAVVQSVDNLSGYFDVVDNAMPRNCSADMKRVIRYMDRVFTNGTEERQQQLKEKFGLGPVKAVDDFFSTLLGPLFSWQSVQFYSGYPQLNQFCDYVENRWPGSNAPQPGEDGVGTCAATKGMAKWFREIGVPGSCDGYSYYANDKGTLDCLDSHNKSSPLYTDVRVRNEVDRQWEWMLCNEPFKYFFGHGDLSQGSTVSKFVTEKYWSDQCALYFPTEGANTFGIAKGKTAADVNAYTGGWDYVDTTRLMWTLGEFDPWRAATVAAAERPQGMLESTEQHPVRIIPKAAHCGDSILANANTNAGAHNVYFEEAANMKKWVEEFYTEKGIKRPTRN